MGPLYIHGFIDGFLWGYISPIKVGAMGPGPDNCFVGPPCRDLTMKDSRTGEGETIQPLGS